MRPIDMLETEMRDRLSAKDAKIARLRDELAKSEDWIRILQKTHETNNRLSEERRSAAARQDAETIASLRDELAESRDEVSALASRERYVTNERDRMRAERSDKQQRISELQAGLDQCCRDYNSAISAASSDAETIARLKGLMADLVELLLAIRANSGNHMIEYLDSQKSIKEARAALANEEKANADNSRNA